MRLLPLTIYFIRQPGLAVICALVLYGCATTSEEIDSRTEQFEDPIFAEMREFDPRVEARSLMNEERYSEAQKHLEYFASIDDVYKDNIEIGELLEEARAKRSSTQYQLYKTYQAIITGKSDESYGETAIMLADFTSIGDLRDFYDEAIKRVNGQALDNLSITLASIGILSTTAPYIKPGLSFLKLANKTGNLPSWLIAEIKQASGSQDGLKSILAHIQTIYNTYQKIGAENTLAALSRSGNAQQFKAYAELSQSLGKQSASLMKIAGNDGLKVLYKYKADPKLIRKVSTYGKSGIKALDTIPPDKLNRFLSYEKTARRRMTNFELEMLKSGKKTTFDKQVVYQKDFQFNPCHKLSTGEINFQRMQQGLAPIGNDGNPINLHHMKQQKDGLLVETTLSDHKKYNEILHRYSRNSEIDRDAFSDYRKLYWKQRSTGLSKYNCKV